MRLSLAFGIFVCCGTLSHAQLPDIGELRSLAEAPAGQTKVFEYLKRTRSSWTQWPTSDELHAKMADRYLEVAERSMRS